jgi:hypothetical protein
VRIMRIRELAAELRGVWIADKTDRIKWLQQYAEDCEVELETATDSRSGDNSGRRQRN